MWIKRAFEHHLSSLRQRYPVLVLTGSRQVGKTSLLQHAVPEASFVSLDLPRLAEEAEESGELFLKRLSLPALIDEVQYAPMLFRYIKHYVDTARPQGGSFLLTGSERFHLMQGVAESLAGRAAVVELYTLAACEIEDFHNTTLEGDALLRMIQRGGYPALYAQDFNSQEFFGNLVATYLERDVKRLSQIQNLRDFDRFMRLIALRSGQLLSMNGIAGEVGVAQTTIKNWISILEASHVISLMQPWHSNTNKRLIKTPKIYFHDTGLCCYLAGIASPEELHRSPLLGNYFETHVFGQLIRSYSNRGLQPRLFFFRTHDGAEVDFVIQHGTEAELIECKWSESPRTDARLIKNFETHSDLTVRRLTYISSARSYRGTRDSRIFIGDSVDIDFLHQEPELSASPTKNR
jgi:uncharacterized protein